MTRSQLAQGAVDTSVAGTVISYPWWAGFLHDGVELLALGGGLVLLFGCAAGDMGIAALFRVTEGGESQ